MNRNFLFIPLLLLCVPAHAMLTAFRSTVGSRLVPTMVRAMAKNAGKIAHAQKNTALIPKKVSTFSEIPAFNSLALELSNSKNYEKTLQKILAQLPEDQEFAIRSFGPFILADLIAWDLVEKGDNDATLKKLIIKNAFDVNAVGFVGHTLLHFAADANKPDLVELLGAHGAFLEARDILNGHTPLAIALTKGNVHAARALLRSGANERIALKSVLDTPTIDWHEKVKNLSTACKTCLEAINPEE